MPAPAVTLLLGIHNHQPDGNFDEVFASGYDDCYRRILEHFEAAPTIRCAFHHTGPLLEWIEQHRPEYLARLRNLVARGQVEILGGAFYEPMLAVLPERDALGQIALMREYCARHLGATPTGMWLAERVWEPGLPLLLERAGVRYTLIDDGHFRYAGESGPLSGYYATEKAGHAIAIFPIEQKLRYAIPFAEPQAAVQTILDLGEAYAAAAGGDVVLTYGDDGEKFGMWPGTKEWVWDKGWLREFLRLLDANASKIRTSTFSDVLATRPPSGRVYLPTASYEEMGEWALPAAAQHHYHEVRHGLEGRGELEGARPFLRGGIWQGFFARYPEANFMHKKMVRVSDRVALAEERHPERSDEIRVMRRELWKAQCNCSYWHGLFGGLYLNYLRDTVFRHLLVAEAFADAMLGRPAPAWAPNAPPEQVEAEIEAADLDADLEVEIAARTSRVEIVVRPHQGGVVQELAYRDKTFMLSNVLGRHEEGYHRKLREHLERERRGGGAGDDKAPKSIHDLVRVKEPNLDRYLVYDALPRWLFADRFLDGDATVEQLERGAAIDRGDFAGGRFDRAGGDGIRLVRVGTVLGGGVRVHKEFHLAGRTLLVRWTIAADPEGPGGPLVDPAELRFATEIPLTLLDGRSAERRFELPDRKLSAEDAFLASRGEWRDVPSLALVNQANGFRVDLRFVAAGSPARPTVWRYPIETVSMSEAGFERTFQGSVIVPLFPLRLAAAPATFGVDLELADL